MDTCTSRPTAPAPAAIRRSRRDFETSPSAKMTGCSASSPAGITVTPNPQQGHYILNGGNPTSGYDFAEVPQYRMGTLPDPQWTPAVFDFGKHVSANGIIQYKSNAFGGRLRRRLL